MKPFSFERHRFPPEAIRHAVWLYFRFSVNFRDVEELLAARGIDVGPQIAKRLKRLRPSPPLRWHLDEIVCSIGGKRMFMRRG